MTQATSFPKSEIKILLLENIHPVATEVFRGEGFQVETVKGALPEAELAARVRDVHVLGIRSKTQITPRVLDEARRMLAVGAFCIGTNQIALGHANHTGMPVFNAPFSNTRSVAELILAEIVMLSRHLGDRSREVHDGRWRKLSAGSHEVRGRTIGIVGYGHIGSQIGVLAEAFGMRVVFFDIMAKLPMGNNRAMARLEDVLEVSDFVTLHVPETPQTRYMIGPDELARMKPGACLLNASRGTVVRIEALADAIQRGHIGGAAVDVYPEEPEANGDGFASPLRNLPNVILTPHIGGSTEEAQEAIGREVSAALIKYINTGATTGSVNFPQIELPLVKDAHRILNVHRNVPGVLRDINRIVSDHNANIRAQVLSTDSDIGYLIMDLDQDVSHDVKRGVAGLPTSIKTRILF
ncbi:MAG TPA: phosphoglycerate dehydrogenase [Kofleriaceae bacterium]|jgi:D-3-phosphoglycerate dehydrogenase|nr:phosphoglycerate dehydrogenase [Kofleriaceae bacterium]